MPYVVGTPVGTFTEEIVQALEKKERYPYKRLREENLDKEQPGSGKNDKEVMLIGEPVTTESLALAIEQKYGISVMYYARYRRRKIYCFEQAGRFLERKTWKKL